MRAGPRDHAHVALHRLPEEQLGGSLPEHVEDDLDRGDARVLDRLQPSSTFSTLTPYARTRPSSTRRSQASNTDGV